MQRLSKQKLDMSPEYISNLLKPMSEAHMGHDMSLFVCLFALRPMSTAMVIAGRSVHLTTLFPGQA